MKIAYLPLDSRPCNYDFPRQLAAFAGCEVLRPAPDEMDHFKTCAPFGASRDFLFRAAGEADALAVSVDHLCYGSLIASRMDGCDTETALSRLDVLREIKKAYPEKPVHLYNVIMRASVNTLSSADLAAYEAMTEYSVYSDKAERTGDPEDRRRADEAEARIPRAVLERYRTARERNHAVNLRSIDLVREGVADSLALLQEDSQIYGFHKREQRILADRIRTAGIKNVRIHNGTDEGGAVCVMRAAVHPPERVPVRVVFTPEGAPDFVALYEDRPFSENLESWLDYAGFVRDGRAKDVLVIAVPPDGHQTDNGHDRAKAELSSCAGTVRSLLDAGLNVYLLDIVTANGGSMTLGAMLAASGLMDRLCGYSAWNTACNSLGTILAQMLSDCAAGKPDRDFLYERIADDLLYQSKLRAILRDFVKAAGDDPHSLGDADGAIRRLQELYASETAFSFLPEMDVTLPWNRVFEAKINCKKTDRR